MNTTNSEQVEDLQKQVEMLTRVLVAEKFRFESQIVLLATRANELETVLKSKHGEIEGLKDENAKISSELVETKQKLKTIESKDSNLNRLNIMLCPGYEVGKDSHNHNSVEMITQIELLKSNLARMGIRSAENSNQVTRDEINQENLELKQQIRAMRFEERNVKRHFALKLLALIKQNKSIQSDLASQKEYIDELKEIICRQYYDLKLSNETTCNFYVRNGRLLHEKQQVESMLSSANKKLDAMFDGVCEFEQLYSLMKQENNNLKAEHAEHLKEIELNNQIEIADLNTRYNELQNRNNYLESKVLYLTAQLNELY
ncbi:hypothetical protein M3Y97_00938700 [Aphelenchoides bicaudatus]|nr:hypothetical protein M3Y97_00938700 [Aphelenchoides bicaudatus]